MQLIINQKLHFFCLNLGPFNQMCPFPDEAYHTEAETLVMRLSQISANKALLLADLQNRFTQTWRCKMEAFTTDS